MSRPGPVSAQPNGGAPEGQPRGAPSRRDGTRDGVGRAAALWLRLRDARATLGVVRTVALAPRWAVRREYLVVVRDPASAPALEAGAGLRADLRWAALDEDALRQLPVVNPQLRRAEIRRRQADGQHCLVAWRGPTVVHYRWDAIRPVYLHYLGAVFRPLPGDSVAVEAFTHPAFRGRGLHTLGTARALAAARAGGISRAIALIAPWHEPALRVGLERAKGHVAGSVTCWEFAVARRLRVTGRVRFTGAALSVG